MRATNIKWETDGQNVQLPTEIEIPSHISADDEDAITDYLSDETGWLVISYDIEDTEEKPYALYSDTVCISEHNTLEEAEEAFDDEIRANPDNEAKVLSADETITYLSYNPDNRSIYHI
jgi:hypothetical protein